VSQMLSCNGWIQSYQTRRAGWCRRWRDIHDASCKTLWVRDGVTEEVMHSLCG
jgi:hypothetical protein